MRSSRTVSQEIVDPCSDWLAKWMFFYLFGVKLAAVSLGRENGAVGRSGVVAGGGRRRGSGAGRGN